MSTIEKTPNYDLTKYNGAIYPLFLGDISDNMSIIDSLIKAINDDIEDINRVIDTVDTRNIDDLIARLGALEIKVDTNANVINGLINSLNGLGQIVDKNTRKIANITDELTTVKEDIEALKLRCDNIVTVLTEHGTEIAENTTAITNINSDITRIKADVIGNAQDIATLATQIQTVMDNKQDKLYAGAGIDITDNVISVTSSGNVIGSYDDTTENLTLG